MQLPFRIQGDPGSEPVVSVDGAFGAPGLNLSHWPGNTTPPDLRHDLSTGAALAFAALSPEERARRAEGCVAVANNHYDTDGALAAFAILYPEEATAHREVMLDAAAAGDLFRCPSELAFQIDQIVTAYADPERSPIAGELSGLEDRERWGAATRALFDILPRLLAGDVEPERELWHEALERLRSDRELVNLAGLDDLVHLDAAVITSSPGEQVFDPGRHAFFERSHADRVLLLSTTDRGTTARFVLSTKSFFDLVTQNTQPRPDLVALCGRLNDLEGTEAGGEISWRHQNPEGASPELWFGTAGMPLYAEHAAAWLAQSQLDPLVIKREVLEAMRRVFVFPDED